MPHLWQTNSGRRRRPRRHRCRLLALCERSFPDLRRPPQQFNHPPGFGPTSDSARFHGHRQPCRRRHALSGRQRQSTRDQPDARPSAIASSGRPDRRTRCCERRRRAVTASHLRRKDRFSKRQAHKTLIRHRPGIPSRLIGNHNGMTACLPHRQPARFWPQMLQHPAC